MLPFELLALGWFAALFVAAPFTVVPRPRRLAVMLGCAALVLLIGFGAPRSSATWRAWLPHAYLILGYWIPGLLASAPAVPTQFEGWLLRSDDALRVRLPSVPAPLVHVVELAYLVCYPLVPASLAIVWTSGDAVAVTRFWVAVLVAGYACYGSLPWLVSRPPRLAAAAVARRQHLLGAANAYVLGRVSHQLNTFPSGHVAVSCAAAGILLTVSPAAGAVVGVIAVAIAVGAVSGRYHYVIDVVLGVLVAGVALAIAVIGGR